MPTDGALPPVATSTSPYRAVPTESKDRVHTPAVPVWSDSHATAKSPLKLAATDACVCCPPPFRLAVRRESVAAPLARPSRTSPMLYDAFASPSSSHTTTASPDADTATSGLWCCPVVCDAVTSHARVVGAVYPAAFTMACAPVWMSSHTTLNATAPLVGAPSGSTATRGLICCPSALVLALPDAVTVPAVFSTRYGML